MIYLVLSRMLVNQPINPLIGYSITEPLLNMRLPFFQKLVDGSKMDTVQCEIFSCSVEFESDNNNLSMIVICVHSPVQKY